MFNLQLEKREIYGKKLAASRQGGKLPVVVYGPKEKTEAYFADTAAFKKMFAEAGESSIVALKIAGEEKDALVQDVAEHPVTGEPIHADFYVVEKGKKLRVKVPLEFSGVSPAVKSLGGVLVKVLHEIEIEAMPRNLPPKLMVDISKLAAFEDQILVKDIALPKEVAAIEKADEVVALVAEPKEEVTEEAAPVDLSKIEVATEKGKKTEEGEAVSAQEKTSANQGKKEDQKTDKKEKK